MCHLPFTIDHLPFLYDLIYKFHSYNGFYNFFDKKKRSFLKLYFIGKNGLRGSQSLVNYSFKDEVKNSTFLKIHPLIYKRVFNLHAILLGGIFLFSSPIFLVAQNTCAVCEVLVPDSLQVDTFYLQELPDGTFQMPYEANLSFRLPVNTTEVLYLDPSLPPNIGISDIKISSIANLPAGLIWTPNQASYDLPDERNGCVMICGMPLQYGLFEVDITVTAQVSILSRDATFSRQLYIAPPSSENSGFSMGNNIGCGQTTVAFTNNNVSEGQAGFSYRWDFGNGQTSIVETPEDQAFEEPGIYPVTYEAIIDTLGARLTEITIVDADCSDILGKADFLVRLYDVLDTLVFEMELPDNTNPPISLATNFPLTDSTYRLEVWDKDSGLGFDDDLCGTINFTATDVDTLQEGDLSVQLSIFHAPDTIRVVDSVVVYDLPDIPTITLEATNFCEGDTMLLNASYADNLVWFYEGLPISNATASTYAATMSGEYHVSYTSENGCVVFSDHVYLETIERPAAPVFSNDKNVLRLFNPNILPAAYTLQWYQEGNLLEASDLEICVVDNGKYGLALMDEATGCTTLFETSIVVDAAIDCTSAIEDLTPYIAAYHLFPNPTNGRLTFDIALDAPLQNVQLQLVNLLGQQVYQQMFPTMEGTQVISLNLSEEVAGIYWLVLTSEEGSSSWRIVKR